MQNELRELRTIVQNSLRHIGAGATQKSLVRKANHYTFYNHWHAAKYKVEEKDKREPGVKLKPEVNKAS